MSFIKSYFAPGKVKAKDASALRSNVPLTHANQVQYAEKHQQNPFDAVPLKSRFPSALNTPGHVSPTPSRPGDNYPPGDFRNNAQDEIRDMKCDVMVNWLYQQQMEMLWTAGGPDEGVVLKKTRGAYACCPADIYDSGEEVGFYKAIEMLNVRVRCMLLSIPRFL